MLAQIICLQFVFSIQYFNFEMIHLGYCLAIITTWSSLSNQPEFSHLCLANSFHSRFFLTTLPNWEKSYNQTICSVNRSRLSHHPSCSAGPYFPYILQALISTTFPGLLLSVSIEEPCGLYSVEVETESIVRCTRASRNIEHTSHQKPWNPCSQPVHAVCCRHQGTRAWIHTPWTCSQNSHGVVSPELPNLSLHSIPERS